MYTVILKQKKQENHLAKNRLVIGLQVLEKAAVAIEELKIEIDEMQPELERTKKALEITMADLAVKR